MDESPTVCQLVAAAGHGDEDAWQALVARYTPLVASVIHGFRLSRADAEDVGQTVWLRLVEHLDALRDPQALPAWVITTTRHECLRLLRSGRRTEAVDPTAGHGELDTAEAVRCEPLARADLREPDEQVLRNERHHALLAAFAELPDYQRDLLLLLIDDPPVPYHEISRRLGIPVGSIGPTRARALQRLRECPLIADWRESTGSPDTLGGRGDEFAVARR